MPNMTALEDKLAIQDLEARYCSTADFGDIEGWVKCFSEDGVLETSVFTLKGADALRKYITQRTQHVSETAPEGCAHPIRHLVMNMIIDVNGVQAKATCYHLMLQITRDGIKIVTTGVTADQLLKEDDQWRITYRRVDASSGTWANQLVPDSFLKTLKGGDTV